MKDQKGQALVELAIALPLVIVLLCGMIDFGWMVYLKSSLTNAARLGARMAVVTKDLLPEEDVVRPTGSLINQAIYKSLIGAIRNDEVYIYGLDIYDRFGVAKPVASVGDQVVVTISCQNPKPFTSIYSMLALSKKINGTASMRYE